jgi:hypothetical protein
VAGFISQNGDRARGVYYRTTAFCCSFLWAKRLDANDIHKEIFHVYSRKCLSREAVRNLVEKFSQGRFESLRWWNWSRELAETTVKRLLCCGFVRTGKAMAQMCQCWWRICREISFSRFEYHMFYVLYPFMTYLLILPRITIDIEEGGLVWTRSCLRIGTNGGISWTR